MTEMSRLKREKIIKWVKRNILALMLLCLMVVQTYMNIQFTRRILALENTLEFLLKFLGFGAHNL